MSMETQGAMEETNRWQNMRAHYPSAADKWAAITSSLVASASEPDHFKLLLKLVGSAFIPYRVQLDHALTQPVKHGSIECCTAKYIVQQYLAATGGVAALNAVNSMYAVGELKMEVASDDTQTTKETGGFVVWQMDPELWFLELMVSGNKITAGSDGKLTWTRTTHSSSTAPPRPLRRFFQGLDPRSTANLFSNTVCVGEKTINDEDCFILKLEASPHILKSQTTPNTELIYHIIWGYFSQRSGLLVQFEDNKLTRMKNATDGSVFYETTLESLVQDYRCVDGINIAHSGTTTASIYRYGEALKRNWKMEETWNIQEVGFNVSGLSPHYFSPPTEEQEEAQNCDDGI